VVGEAGGPDERIGARIEPAQAAVGADPEAPGAILVKYPHLVSAEAVRVGPFVAVAGDRPGAEEPVSAGTS
ncbi:MAG: hypothetical protein R3320_11125, partial [Nitriliruptorales bacterium]|nr:hypothetical protein [Nitriliruptorales bacterium]